MGRTLKSAKRAGALFETVITERLRSRLGDWIERRVTNGAKDRGDISGVRAHGKRVVIECKNTARLSLSQWIAEAHTEAGNDDALVGIIIHKRHGVSAPGKQWVTMTVDDLISILTGEEMPDRYEP